MHINDESLVKRFEYTASVMDEDFRGANFAAVYENVRELSVSGRRKVVYCVLEYVNGEALDMYLRAPS